MLRNVLLGAGIFAVVLSILIFSGKIPIGRGDNTPKGQVLIWGTIPEESVNDILQTFNPKAKTYSVSYKYVPEVGFSQTLLEALASGSGPDLILTPYQTILAQESRIVPFPVTSLGEKSFKDTYVDGASVFFTRNGAIALPVSVEPMVLFYNRAMFSKHGIPAPPQYWDEITDMVTKINVKEGNTFLESTIALGTPGTPYAKDILMAIVSQLGQTPIIRLYDQSGEAYYNISANDASVKDSTIKPLTVTARYFTQFADAGQINTYTWSDAFGKADDAFVAEKLAMYIGYVGELGPLRARNPRGEFEITYLPQTRGYNTFSTGLRMYGIATLKTTKNPQVAFTVQGQFSGGDIAPVLASTVGGVPGLRAFAATPGLDAVVAKSMLVARGWIDSHELETANYTGLMVSDIINYRYGVVDAVNIFIGRMRDLYAKKI